MDEVSLSSREPTDLASGLHALVTPSLTPAFWRPERIGAPSSWWQHVPFGQWIVCAAKPRVLVELGTHAGVSYTAFCQAIAQSGLDTRCYAVDTWQGDSHAGPYDEEVFAEFSRFHDARYGDFSTLLRTTFDEALTKFATSTIDLLHIDGLHTYEAVRHDFESWKPKLSQNAIVLFHDTNVRRDDFGVWRLWDELCEQFPHFEFLHGHGLGLLAVGTNVPALVLELCHFSESSAVAAVRSRFAALGDRCLSQTREHMLAQAEQAWRKAEASTAETAANAEARARQAEVGAAQAEASAAQAEQARREAEASAATWKARARETEDARDLIVRRMSAARRDVYNANLRAEQEEAKAREARAMLDALLSSTVWQATWPLRAAGRLLPPSLRRTLRRGAKLGWWSLTLKLPRKLRERRGARALQSVPPAILLAPQPGASAAQSISTIKGIAVSNNGTASLSLAECARDETPRILFVSGEPETPGHLYRIIRPIAAIGSGAAWLRAHDIPAHLGEIEAAEVLILWRTAWDENIGAAITTARRGGTKIIFDVDDLMIDPGLARLEVIDGIRTNWLTEDTVRGHFERVRQTMQAADLCITTTEELAFHLRWAGKTTHVLPNGFDQATHDLSRSAARAWHRTRTDQLIRIGYASGSRTHQRDFGLAVDAIARILRENQACCLVLFRSPDGSPFIDVEEYAALVGLEDRIEWRVSQPPIKLPLELARFDINLAPVEFGNPFCEAKSELKYFEAALVDVPTIASPTGPFRRAIEHGNTGFLAATANDWYIYLKQLVEAPELRRRIASAAYLASLATCGPIQRAAQLGRILDQVRGGVSGANAFALAARLSAQPRQIPKVFASDVVFEHNANDHADVTVIIPLYNYETYVIDALESVREQTLSSLDLVVVDGFSTDNSLSVAAAWAKKNAKRFNRIAVLQNRANYGLAFCRNSGFDAAYSPYVLPLDADNKLAPKCCEALLETIRCGDAVYAYPTIQQFGDASSLANNVPYDPQRLVAGNYIDAMALVSKEAWAIVGGYDHVRHGWEDFDFWCRLAERGLQGEWRPEVLAHYRVHHASLTKQAAPSEHCRTAPSDSYRSLMTDFKRRHPWVSLVEQHISQQFPPPNPYFVESTAQTRIDKLLPILRCPLSKTKLAYNADRTALVSVDGLHTWPVRSGRPVLSAAIAEPEVHPDQHISNDLPDVALDMIRETSGFVLNLSAGGSRAKFDHVVEVEYSIFRHTDVVADAHDLPFFDETFEAIVVMNAFEHYRNPHEVAAELLRILKPGGRILVRTAFMQPLHERPWHFYNCTRYGLAEWFKDFDIERLHVSDNFCPNHSIAWLASEAETALRSDVSAGSADTFASAPIGSLIEMWRDPGKRATPLWTNFDSLSQATQEVTAAGFELLGRKPPPFPDLAGTRRRSP
jgi:glycosyltransferase involved in cell wall biosynthesis/GT2 family glycosyltransferase/SAM-dependent methyltransferase/uncharacterized protein YbaR (Trm112 family)